MPLLNYTTTISADKSIAAIQKVLAKAGASAILHEYDQNGNIMALSFRIKLDDKDITFRLPTDWRAVQKRLEAQRVEPVTARRNTRYVLPGASRRIGSKHN